MRLIGLKEFSSLSPEEKNAMGEEAMWHIVERSVNEIAKNRRNAELQHGISNEKFDEKLNEMCAKANDKYAGMSNEELAIDMLTELLEHIEPQDFAELLFK